MVDRNIYVPFHISTDVLQGDVTLVPFLFIIVVNYILKKSTHEIDSGIVTHQRKSRRHPTKVLNGLDFADDIALLESTLPRAQVHCPG